MTRSRKRMVLWTVCSLLASACGSGTGASVNPSAVGGRAVTFKTAIGGKFLSAENGGGGVIDATRDVASTWETFQLHDRNGGDLNSGAPVNLQALDGKFVCAEKGGRGTVGARPASCSP